MFWSSKSKKQEALNTFVVDCSRTVVFTFDDLMGELGIFLDVGDIELSKVKAEVFYVALLTVTGALYNSGNDKISSIAEDVFWLSVRISVQEGLVTLCDVPLPEDLISGGYYSAVTSRYEDADIMADPIRHQNSLTTVFIDMLTKITGIESCLAQALSVYNLLVSSYIGIIELGKERKI